VVTGNEQQKGVRNLYLRFLNTWEKVPDTFFWRG
jgi:hypothetical protein